MRVLLYGMQASGASLITFFLGQRPESLALIDVWVRHLTPPLAGVGTDAVIAKCVISSAFELDDHIQSFKPDRTILVLRHPEKNYFSLRAKSYGSEAGTIEEKFARLESAFQQRGRFDMTIAFEDFVASPERTVQQFQEVGIDAKLSYYDFPRSSEEIRNFNVRHEGWCRDNYNRGWGHGNVQGTRLNSRKLYRPSPNQWSPSVRQIAPTVSDHYQKHYAWLPERPA